MTKYRPRAERFSSSFGERDSRPTDTSSDGDNVTVKLLRRGDKVSITLRDIPSPQEIRDVIDDEGSISLPLVGTLKIEGMTTSEAESMIEDAYVKGRYYKKINVTVVGGEEEYFISGEVKREGKYALSPGLTLLRAIAEAGGYTEFADKSKVTIKRSGVVQTYDGKKIARGDQLDPVIKSGDIITVKERRY